jgi:hypothetical protein
LKPGLPADILRAGDFSDARAGEPSPNGSDAVSDARASMPADVAAMIANMREGLDLGGEPFTEDDRYGAAAIGT